MMALAGSSGDAERDRASSSRQGVRDGASQGRTRHSDEPAKQGGGTEPDRRAGAEVACLGRVLDGPGLAQVGRQDRRGEPHLTGLPVVLPHPRRFHGGRAGPGQATCSTPLPERSRSSVAPATGRCCTSDWKWGRNRSRFHAESKGLEGRGRSLHFGPEVGPENDTWTAIPASSSVKKIANWCKESIGYLFSDWHGSIGECRVKYIRSIHGIREKKRTENPSRIFRVVIWREG